MEDKQWKYKIGSGKVPMILTFMMLVLFGGLAIWLHKMQNGVFIFLGMFATIMLILFGANRLQML